MMDQNRLYKDKVRRVLRDITKPAWSRYILSALSRSGLLPNLIWKRLPVNDIFSVHLSEGCEFKYSTISNDIIGRNLYWRGLNDWESETIPIFYQLAKKAKLVLDIGANTGVYSLIACAANPDSRVIAFEPVPRVYNRLVENITINKFQSRCSTRQEAVSDYSGTAKFSVLFNDIPTSSSLHISGFRGREHSVINVSVTTVDDLCKGDSKVDLVKIDVEGFEDKVLLGMQNVLETSTPSIIVECNPDGPYVAVEEIIRSFNYQIFHLRKNGPVPIKNIVPDRSERYKNFLCVPG